MIIQSIRLKNIKSYGEGADGKGVTIPFQPGINRIAGRNGHGKSTLIESLGYALFLTKPEFEENFQIERYFLSHGAKEGEIDITFTYGQESYRIERGIGKQSKRRSKVIQIKDGSICAENDAEVSRFLCELLNFPTPDRLNEMFSKLIGVKQGRLTWPFDSKPAEAKRFFEPLLDVAVFRECFDRLKPAVDIFKEQASAKAQERSALVARLNDRADSKDRVVACRQATEKIGTDLQLAKDARDVAFKLKGDLEQLEMMARNAKVKAEQCQVSLNNTTQVRDLAEKAFNEAQSASAKMQQNQTAYNAYTDATTILAQLELKRNTRDVLRKQRDSTDLKRTQSAAKAAAARSQTTEFTSQKATKENDRSELQTQVEPLNCQLQSTKSAFEEEKSAAGLAGAKIRAVSDFIAGTTALLKSQAQKVDRISVLTSDLASWDAGKLIKASTAEKAARQVHEGAKDQLARAKERLGTLRDQLKEISGGLCPFLKEQCRQFDPAKITADIESCIAQIKKLETDERNAGEQYAKEKDALEHLVGLQNQILAKRSELENALNGYVEPMRSVVTEKVRTAVTWLMEWDATLTKMPNEPVCPEEFNSAETILALHLELVAYVQAVVVWWKNTEQHCQEHLNLFRAQELNRQSLEHDIRNKTDLITALTKEIKELETKILEKQTEAAKQESDCNNFVAEITQLEQQLTPYAELDGQLAGEQQIQAVNRPGYEIYIGAKNLAEQLVVRATNLAKCKDDEANADTALNNARIEETSAREAFDPEKLSSARTDYLTKRDSATVLTETLKTQEQSLKNEETRFEEWQVACRELQNVDRHIGRCEAAIDLTEVARRTLRDAAPEVAQHLCRRIAHRAQRVFNQINPEPVELEWEAEHYSLRAAPSDRRFAMLSGGEQTKLALAMTLAMIEEFSGLRFCIFDEPTYGVDADSRKKLAETILDVQQAAGLEQLLLVSHDDAFEGKIEHSIILSKTAAEGTLASVN